MPKSDKYDGTKLVTKIDGKRAVPMFLALMAIGSPDRLLAPNSTPDLRSHQDWQRVLIRNVRYAPLAASASVLDESRRVRGSLWVPAGLDTEGEDSCYVVIRMAPSTAETG